MVAATAPASIFAGILPACVCERGAVSASGSSSCPETAVPSALVPMRQSGLREAKALVKARGWSWANRCCARAGLRSSHAQHRQVCQPASRLPPPTQLLSSSSPLPTILRHLERRFCSSPRQMDRHRGCGVSAGCHRTLQKLITHSGVCNSQAMVRFSFFLFLFLSFQGRTRGIWRFAG